MNILCYPEYVLHTFLRASLPGTMEELTMELNPALNKVDRIVNLLMGIAAIAYALLGGIEVIWARAVLAALGVVLVIGAVGGT